MRGKNDIAVVYFRRRTKVVASYRKLNKLEQIARRETELQGGIVLTKSGTLEITDDVLQTL